MNTFGLKKKGLNPFWLMGGSRIIKAIFENSKRFKVYINSFFRNKVEITKSESFKVEK